MNQEIEITAEIINKSESIHWFLNQINIEEGKLEGAIQVHKKELAALQAKQNSVNKSRDRMKDLIMYAVDNVGKENQVGSKVLKTDTKKYTVYEGDGPLEVIDEDQIPKSYYKLERKLDRKRLRDDLRRSEIDEKSYARVPKVKRLRIS